METVGVQRPGTDGERGAETRTAMDGASLSSFFCMAAAYSSSFLEVKVIQAWALSRVCQVSQARALHPL